MESVDKEEKAEVKNEVIEPDREYLKVLLDMGIEPKVAERALRKTRNTGIEIAASCALELMENTDLDNDDFYWEDVEDEEYKMVFVVNSGLNMSPGKLAAQVAHGALGLYRQLITQPEQCVNLNIWQDIGEKKIVLKGKDEQHLAQLENLAKLSNVASLSIRDAGHTEIPPNSFTVLALFGLEHEVDKVTSKLRLL